MCFGADIKIRALYRFKSKLCDWSFVLANIADSVTYQNDVQQEGGLEILASTAPHLVVQRDVARSYSTLSPACSTYSLSNYWNRWFRCVIYIGLFIGYCMSTICNTNIDDLGIFKSRVVRKWYKRRVVGRWCNSSIIVLGAIPWYGNSTLRCTCNCWFSNWWPW